MTPRLRGALKGLPRGIPAASLKPRKRRPQDDAERQSSAGNTRGLIEAEAKARGLYVNLAVFRGEYPRPH